MTRVLVDVVPVAALVVLSRMVGANQEGVRMAILAGVLAVLVLLALFRVISQRAYRAASVAAAATLLALAWFQSFPAGNHAGEVGAYLVVGVLTLVLALWGERGRSSQPAPA